MTVSNNISYMTEHGNILKTAYIRHSDFNSEYACSLPSDILCILLDNIHYVERYKSDLIIDIESINKGLRDNNFESIHVLAYRCDGVDHNSYVDSTLKSYFMNHGSDPHHYYRKTFIIKIHVITENDTEDIRFNNIGDVRIDIIDATNAYPYKNLDKEAIDA